MKEADFKQLAEDISWIGYDTPPGASKTLNKAASILDGYAKQLAEAERLNHARSCTVLADDPRLREIVDAELERNNMSV